MLEARPFSIKFFVPDGDPDSLRIVEKSNWTGVGVVFNRTNFKQASARDEFGRTGIYILVGSSGDSHLPTVYVGEGDPVQSRLQSHYANKDFWDWAVFFVSKDRSLNKAHVKHLESRLLRLASEAKQCRLDNSQASQPPTLSEAETADVDAFLNDMLSIFPLLGLHVFERIVSAPAQAKTEDREMLQLTVKGLRASGYESPKGFVVCAGSQAVTVEQPSIHDHMRAARKDFLEGGVFKQEGDALVFTQDWIFNSPSFAGGVITGRPTNGRKEWTNAAGKSLRRIQAEAAKGS